MNFSFLYLSILRFNIAASPVWLTVQPLPVQVNPVRVLALLVLRPLHGDGAAGAPHPVSQGGGGRGGGQCGVVPTVVHQAMLVGVGGGHLGAEAQ